MHFGYQRGKKVRRGGASNCTRGRVRSPKAARFAVIVGGDGTFSLMLL